MLQEPIGATELIIAHSHIDHIYIEPIQISPVNLATPITPEQSDNDATINPNSVNHCDTHQLSLKKIDGQHNYLLLAGNYGNKFNPLDNVANKSISSFLSEIIHILDV